MTHGDWLATFAEIAVGFAGFSALIAGIGVGSQPLSRQSVSRCLAVIETSLGVLFSAVLPVLFHGFGLAESTAFRVSGALLLAIGGPLSWRGVRRFRAASAEEIRPAGSPLLALAGLAAVLVSIGAALLCIVGAPAAVIPTYYLTSLLGTLGIAATNFIGFVVAYTREEA